MEFGLFRSYSKIIPVGLVQLGTKMPREAVSAGLSANSRFILGMTS